jgi:hypothetical protein
MEESVAAANKYNAELQKILKYHKISPPDKMDGFEFYKTAFKDVPDDAKWFLKEVDSTGIPSSDGQPQVWLMFKSPQEDDPYANASTRVPIKDIENDGSLDKWLTMNNYKRTQVLEEKNLREKLQQKLAPLIRERLRGG